MYLFYAPDIAQSPILSEEESQHCVQVLRANMGDPVLVTDGKGRLYHCVVSNPHRKHCELQILHVETPDPLHTGYVHIAIAPTKNIDRLEWMIEKCTEMGVDEISLLLCEHSQRKSVNLDRLQKIMISAAKQSLKTTFPKLNEMTKCLSFIQEEHAETDLFIAHCMSAEDNDDTNDNNTLQTNYQQTDNKRNLQQLIVPGHHVLMMIGPEGDFSPVEVQCAFANGFLPVSLGPARLRTETAGLVACHTAVLLNS